MPKFENDTMTEAAAIAFAEAGIDDFASFDTDENGYLLAA